MNIFVTGGGGGIGSAIVRLLAQDPANEVYFTHRGGGAAVDSLVKECPRVRAVRCDLSAPADLDRVKKELSGVEIDVLVNNAFPKPSFADLGRTEWADVERQLAGGVRGAFELAKFFSRGMKRRKSGSIITILSSVVVTPAAMMSSYVIAKHALLGLHQALACELAPFGVRVNAVSPSFTRTPMLSELPDHYVALAEQASPLKRLAEPIEVAEVVRFLLSEKASHINGANMPVTGGE